jgi:hypothetical protein
VTTGGTVTEGEEIVPLYISDITLINLITNGDTGWTGRTFNESLSAHTIYEGQKYGVKAVTFTQKTNTKRMRFSLNGALNNINLSNKAKIIIESVTIPNILSHTFKQSKCINNIQLR